jgi:hypothetical protein
MTLGDLLIPRLHEQFPGQRFREGISPSPVALFAAAHPDVGDVSIYDDGREAIVSIGAITHGHFADCDSSLSDEEAAREAADQVLDFLEKLFADRVILWKSPGGHSGGWQVMDRGEDFTLLNSEDTTYLWSGPVKNPKKR